MGRTSKTYMMTDFLVKQTTFYASATRPLGSIGIPKGVGVEWGGVIGKIPSTGEVSIIYGSTNYFNGSCIS